MTSLIPDLDLPPGPLVNGDWLAANLDQPRVRILDGRGRHPSSSLAHAKRAEYSEGHIPGAIFIDWEKDFVDAGDPVPYQVASPGAFASMAPRLASSMAAGAPGSRRAGRRPPTSLSDPP